MTTMSTIRSALGAKVDQAAKLLADGYLFQERLRASKGRKASDGCPLDFTFMGKPATLVRGSKGIDLFYDTKRVKREQAMPLPVRGPLFGAGAIHGTDDDVHLARKANFVKWYTTMPRSSASSRLLRTSCAKWSRPGAVAPAMFTRTRWWHTDAPRSSGLGFPGVMPTLIRGLSVLARSSRDSGTCPPDTPWLG